MKMYTIKIVLRGVSPGLAAVDNEEGIITPAKGIPLVFMFS
jgi:hypothetical protein